MLPTRADLGRRRALAWSVAAQRHDPNTGTGRIFSILGSLPHWHARIPSRILAVINGVLATVRHAPIGSIVCLHNVTDVAAVPRFSGASRRGAEPWDGLSGG